MDKPLLTEPLRPEHLKPRLLGNWGTTPGLNLLHAKLIRVIKARDLEARPQPADRTVRPRFGDVSPSASRLTG